MQSLVVTGYTATLYGTADLPDGTPVTFQMDVCEGFVSGRARLRLSTGYDSGWQGVLTAGSVHRDSPVIRANDTVM